MAPLSAFSHDTDLNIDPSGEAQSALTAVASRRRKFAAGQSFIHQGHSTNSAYVLLQGWACSYVLLSNGSRQIVAFHIPGDTLGLRSVLFRELDHSVEPITAIDTSEVMISDLMEVFAHSPRLATSVLWTVSRDVAMIVANLVGMGRRSAAERIAYCLLELSARLRLVGLATRAGFACPLSQYQMADALGLSAVHVNRVLRELREAGMMTFQKGQVVFHDYDRLATFADFDRNLLDQMAPKAEWGGPKFVAPLPVHRPTARAAAGAVQKNAVSGHRAALAERQVKQSVTLCTCDGDAGPSRQGR